MTNNNTAFCRTKSIDSNRDSYTCMNNGPRRVDSSSFIIVRLVMFITTFAFVPKCVTKELDQNEAGEDVQRAREKVMTTTNNKDDNVQWLTIWSGDFPLCEYAVGRFVLWPLFFSSLLVKLSIYGPFVHKSLTNQNHVTIT